MIASAWCIVATTDVAVTLLYYLSHIYNSPTYTPSPITTKINCSLCAVWHVYKGRGFVTRKTVLWLKPAGIPDIMWKGDLKLFYLQLERTDVVHFFLAAGDFTAVGLMDGNKKEHGMLHCFTNKSCIG